MLKLEIDSLVNELKNTPTPPKGRDEKEIMRLIKRARNKSSTESAKKCEREGFKGEKIWQKE